MSEATKNMFRVLEIIAEGVSNERSKFLNVSQKGWKDINSGAVKSG